MRLSAPSFLIFLLSLILGIIAIIQVAGLGGTIPYYSQYVGAYLPAGKEFWMMSGAWLLLMIGSLFRGL